MYTVPRFFKCRATKRSADKREKKLCVVGGSTQLTYIYLQGRAVFASGSPFDHVEYNGIFLYVMHSLKTDLFVLYFIILF